MVLAIPSEWASVKSRQPRFPWHVIWLITLERRMGICLFRGQWLRLSTGFAPNGASPVPWKVLEAATILWLSPLHGAAMRRRPIIFMRGNNCPRNGKKGRNTSSITTNMPSLTTQRAFIPFFLCQPFHLSAWQKPTLSSSYCSLVRLPKNI